MAFLQRPWQRAKGIEWMWQSNENPFDLSQKSEWKSYSDVETIVIEEAYQKKQSAVLLDQYHINLEQLIQVSNIDEKKQRPVKRIALSTAQWRVRKERFLADPIEPSKPFSTTRSHDFLVETVAYYNLWYTDESRLLIEKAAEGLTVEGKLLGTEWEGRQMAELLLLYKDYSREEIVQMCAYLYSFDSFLYRKLNEIMRLIEDNCYEHVWKSKVPTLGPFAYLLNCLATGIKYSIDLPVESMTVYRGCNLSAEAIEKFKAFHTEHQAHNYHTSWISFLSFTSTSRSREKAEFIGGNALFIIKICTHYEGCDISPYSRFDEEEFLLIPTFSFLIVSCNYDEHVHKWIIGLESANSFHNSRC
ncbi:hypothetical protein I4U23_021980 [Adineta vaga]|nr:hypothetical protein I4U23_021980 [Adineta vaga]